MEEKSPPTAVMEAYHSAGRRAREVYRYFRPERLGTISENASLSSGISSQRGRVSRDDQSIHQSRDPSVLTERSTTQSSQDSWAALGSLPESMVLGEPSTTLKSFAQLAAFRLNVDRVFISVSNRDSQFIIAQAAQTTKGDGKYDFLGDGVYTGCSTLDASSWKICKDTIALAPSNRLTGEYNFLVSNDLSQDDRYKTLPFVKEEPNFRFYAGTPLTTESNINIGCFFVLDTKTHAEFTHLEKETMAHMGMLIMDFLKVSRQASEGLRASRLSHGLSCFVEGQSSLTSNEQDTAAGDDYRKPGRSSGISTNRTSNDQLDGRSLSSGRSGSRSNSAYSLDSASELSVEKSIPSSFDSNYGHNWSQNKAKDEGETHRGNSWTFRRAANLIRESLELNGNDGVVFVESDNDPMHNSGSDSELSSSVDNSKAVTVLALSTEDGGTERRTPLSCSISNLDEDFLRRLLNRYSRGNIWSFHRDGLLSSSDSEESEGSPEPRGRKNPSLKRMKAQKRKTTENSILNKCFPGASQIIFVPLWNPAHSQWFGGFFCWNTIESNVFNPLVELSSLLGFGTSIMSECNRVDSLIADRQKGDFLGSISHELRSPLHGVLAAAEMMQSTELTTYQSSLMETIDACGRTLLDTMNQVLDYSKIVSLERQLRHLKKRGDQSPNLRMKHRSAAHLDIYTVTDVSALAEEVVEGVSLGHQYSQRHQSPGYDSMNSITGGVPEPHVLVDLDIANHNWVYHTAPGALRRIIMNIFSNAMKYTSEGRVLVRLEVKESSENTHQQAQRPDLVTLTVSDTGKGISDDFLRGRLFVPFAQEDTLASGSGLGLSIVRSLLKSLDGNINVQTQVGKGTTVKVTVPLYRSEPDNCVNDMRSMSQLMQRQEITSDLSHIRRDFSGRKVAIWGLQLDSVSKHPFWSMVSHYLTEWFGLELVSPSSGETIDILLVEEIPSQSEINEKVTGDPAFLQIDTKGVGHDSIKVNSLPATKFVDIIHRPCGPHKLGRIIRKCLQHPLSLPSIADLNIVPENLKPPIKKQLESKPNNTLSAISDTSTESPQISSKKDVARILVVEDNKINLNLMLTFLKQREIPTLDSAENGQLAVAAVQEETQGYDIIFMDISMPVMDGFEAARNIRAIEKERNASEKPAIIIALTGLSSQKDESEAIESGMDFFLTKPVAFKQVAKILDGWGEAGLLEQTQPTQHGVSS
ncbi:hypothetical protein N7533_003299 [Penicillium manginii]|uniref:uncharacterized protein n=1 Tax=Penicillium manginii TaxID=203109 RepID=UPI002546F69C|nr:uncharacterized protein N7533_003299 [Penicillium manginii]KAJ5764618.1 hypothetical protein N7533_003299 [Penicillium manginii]